MFSCKKETIKPIEEAVTVKDSIISNNYYYYRIFKPALNLTNKELNDSFEIDYGKKEIIKIYKSGTYPRYIYITSKEDIFNFTVGNVASSGSGELGNINNNDTINTFLDGMGERLGMLFEDGTVYARPKKFAGISYNNYTKFGWMSFDSSDTTFFLKEFYLSKVEAIVLAGVVNDTNKIKLFGK